MKHVALLVYPECSIQEVSTLMYIFRWFYDTKTTTFSSSHDIVYTEEGLAIRPEKTFDEFKKDDNYCFIIPGCSDFEQVLQDEKLFLFLHSLKDEKDFVIGAICGGPLLLSIASLLGDKKFVNSLFYEMNTEISFIHEENICYQPVVVDGNMITAVGEAFREFAIAVARACGFSCRDEAMMGVGKDWKKEDFIYYLPKEETKKKQEFISNVENTYRNLPFHS